jgi:hypothetical protein
MCKDKFVLSCAIYWIKIQYFNEDQPTYILNKHILNKQNNELF